MVEKDLEAIELVFDTQTHVFVSNKASQLPGEIRESHLAILPLPVSENTDGTSTSDNAIGEKCRNIDSNSSTVPDNKSAAPSQVIKRRRRKRRNKRMIRMYLKV